MSFTIEPRRHRYPFAVAGPAIQNRDRQTERRYLGHMAHLAKPYAERSLGDLHDQFTSSTEGEVTGVCPECKAPTARTYRMVSLVASEEGGAGYDDDHRGGGLLRRDGLLTMVCDCGLQHDGRPDEGIGCGARWKVLL